MFIAIILSSVILLSLSGFFFIRHQYKDFCVREDRKERIGVLKARIRSAKPYLRKNYDSPIDHTVSADIIPKIEFCIKLIEKNPEDKQEYLFQKLLDLTTETLYRLRTDFDNIPAIVSPLNTLRDQLVQSHLDYIKDHLDGIIDEFNH